MTLENKNKVRHKFLDRKTKYGLRSTFMVLFVTLFLVLLNIFVNKFDLKYDLTKEKIYTISDETKKIINAVTQKINIYFLDSKEHVSLVMSKLLDQYKTENINVDYKDPKKFPEFAKSFETTKEIQDGSIIVKAKNKFKVIDADDLVTYDYDYNTFQQKVKSIDLEPELTNAIRYVTSESTPAIYELTGNGEKSLSDDYKKQIELANYEIKDLNLITQSKIPDDCKMLIITTPKRDWTPQESEILNKFFQDGSALICISYTDKEFPNMTNVIKKYGFEFGRAIIAENSSSNFINDNFSIIPNYTGSEILKHLEEKKYAMLLPACQNIIINNADDVTQILISSGNSYAKTKIPFTSAAKEPNDISGPLNIAVSYKKDKSKIIALGSDYIIDPNLNSFIGGTNCDFVISSVNYLCNAGNSDGAIYIPPKTRNPERINFTHKQALVIAGACVVVFPSAIFILGTTVIRKRRQV